MPRQILIIDDSSDLDGIAQLDLSTYSDLLLLWWAAPETLERFQRQAGPSCHTLLQIVGGFRRWEREAIVLMEEICATGPAYRGRPWRAYLSEPLFREALTVQAVLDAIRFCRRRTGAGATAVMHLSVGLEVERLWREIVGEDAELRVEVIAGTEGSASRRPGMLGRLIRRFRHAHLTGGWLTQSRNLAARADLSYRARSTLGRLFPKPRIEPQGLTFFSSYLNNSRTLKHLEPYLPGQVTWIVTNDPARQGAGASPAAVHDLWRFAPGSDPSAIREDHSAIHHRHRGVSMRDQAQRAWLAGSPTWRSWLAFGYAALCRLTACWEHYLETARPRLVVVAGHWGIEGWLSRVAQDRGVPVVELLHGVLGGSFYTQHPLSSDALIVWGDFWRKQRPAQVRPKVHVFNPGVFATARETPRRVAEPPRLTYFSWPFDRVPYYHGGELLDGFISLFHGRLEVGACELTIRAHPLENLSDFTRRWQRRHGDLPEQVRLSQNEPLSEILARTDLAVMLRSTVMLDCFARGIPVLLPGWIDFGWNRSLEGIAGIHLAKDFSELQHTLSSWLQEPPELDREMARQFVRPVGEGRDSLDDLLAELWRDDRHRTPQPSLDGGWPNRVATGRSVSE